MLAQAISNTNTVTPSRIVSGLVRLADECFVRVVRSASSICLAWKRSIVCSLMPFWSGASTSLIMRR